MVSTQLLYRTFVVVVVILLSLCGCEILQNRLCWLQKLLVLKICKQKNRLEKKIVKNYNFSSKIGIVSNVLNIYNLQQAYTKWSQNGDQRWLPKCADIVHCVQVGIQRVGRACRRCTVLMRVVHDHARLYELLSDMDSQTWAVISCPFWKKL